MAQYKNAVMTSAGATLLLKAQAGKCKIKITRMVTGDGEYTEEESAREALRARKKLKNFQQAFDIDSVSVISDKTALITSNITNHIEGEDLVSGYYINEIGVYAMEEGVEGTEVLYSITLAEIPDFMPPYNGRIPATIIQRYHVTVDNSADIHIEVNKETLLSDDATGELYKIGVENGAFYCRKIG